MTQISRRALLSSDGLYRFTLTREREEGKGTVCFIMQNPSTADADIDDPTIRRCMDYAWQWGFKKLVVVNLCAYRATDPKELNRLSDAKFDGRTPDGRYNDRVIWDEAEHADLVVCAWGVVKGRLLKLKAVDNEETLRGYCFRIDSNGNRQPNERVKLHYLELSKDGYPKHPLYLRKNLAPKEWKK